MLCNILYKWKISRLPTKVSKTIPGFSLMEISIVLLIMGILMSAVMVGKNQIDIAQAKAVANDLFAFQVAITNYKNSGKKISEEDVQQLEQHLVAAGMIDYKSPKFGGTYKFVLEDNVLKIVLDNLTKKQYITLLSMVTELFGPGRLESNPKEFEKERPYEAILSLVV
jgi:prepilin-type N-terminal cleavage/methylation domain-containing protein